jgi:riboflavin kinase / FMN adenylyltransferase
VIQARSLGEIGQKVDSVCTVGSYDGIHRAHQKIISEVSERAKSHGMRSVVITFDPHPKEVVKSARGPVELLTTLEERITVLRHMDIDLLLIIPFTYEFSRLSSREFYKQYLVDGLSAQEVVVGYDHMFGRDRESGIKDVVDLGNEFGFSVHTVPPFYVGDEVVSSTKIRKLLKAGNVSRAAEFLGWTYSLRGNVVRGDGRGAQLGFPTANVVPEHNKKLIPGRGVYFVTGTIESRIYPGMMNIGTRPTFKNDGQLVLEVHFLNDVPQLYGLSIDISFYLKLRDERKFDSPEELMKTLHNDKNRCTKLAENLIK